jgi:hypothetical protein
MGINKLGASGLGLTCRAVSCEIFVSRRTKEFLSMANQKPTPSNIAPAILKTDNYDIVNFCRRYIISKNKTNIAVFLIKNQAITYKEEKVEQLEAVLRHHRSTVDSHPYLFNEHLIWYEKKGNINFIESEITSNIKRKQD